MQMINEFEIRKKVIEYLLSLGWLRNSIAIDYRISAQQKADIVIKEIGHSTPLIVIELKSKLNTDELQDDSRLRFNPSVRQLQRYASMVKADYYLLSNGDIFIWLETDSTGRPRRLANPVRPSTTTNKKLQQVTSREEVIRVFRQLLDHLRDQSDWIIQDSQIALILLAFFTDVLGKDKSLRKALEELSENDIHRFNYVKQFGLPPNELATTRETAKAFELLDQISFLHVNSSDILLAIDDVFFQRIQSLYSISRWLADALVTFAELYPGSHLLDIAANVGNILAAASLSHSNLTTITGMARNPRDAVWAKVQQAIIGNFASQIQSSDVLTQSFKSFQSAIEPTHIITAPVMGERIQDFIPNSELFHRGIRHIEDLLLETAINTVTNNGCVVFLVPEGLLFGGGSRYRVRDLIIKRTTIKAVIGLDNGALKPFSSIKTSILILENRQAVYDDLVFMSTVTNINEIPYPNTILSYTEIPDVARVIREYSYWRSEGVLPTDTQSWLVPISQIEPDNLSASYYQPDSISAPINELRYPLLPISEVCSLVQRGNRIKLVDGPLKVIGPATIRAMRMDLNSIGYTSIDEISASPLRVAQDDVVLNNIGTHLGAAAVITDEIAGSYVSQHVMLLRAKREYIEPTFLAAVINSQPIQAQIEKQATGSVMPSLTIKRLNNLNIPVPDLETQRKIVQSINQAHNEVVIAEEKLQKAKVLFENLLSNLGTG